MIGKDVHSTKKSCGKVRHSMTNEFFIRIDIFVQRYSCTTHEQHSPSVRYVMPGRTTSATLTQGRNVEGGMQYIEKQPSSPAKSATCVVRMSHKMTHNANCVGSVVQIGVHRTARQSLSQSMSQYSTISMALRKKMKPTIISIKGIPTIHTPGLPCRFEQPSVPSERAEVKLGGRDDNVKDNRYD